MKKNQNDKMSKEGILKLIYESSICNMCVASEDNLYVVPMYYKAQRQGDKLLFKLISYEDGMKMSMIQNNNKVTLQIFDADDRMFKTVLVFGIANVILNENEIKTGDDDYYADIIVKANKITGRKFRY